MNACPATFTLRYTDGRPDEIRTVPTDATVQMLLPQLPSGQHPRIVCAGQELSLSDPVSSARGRVFVVTFSNVPPEPCRVPGNAPANVETPLTSLNNSPNSSQEAPPLDWLDMVDPGKILMRVFGGILLLLWVLAGIFRSAFFERTSIMVLGMMTVAYLLPIILSHLPFPTFLMPHPQTPPYAPGQQPQSTTGPTQASFATSEQAEGSIPPRPAARRRGQVSAAP
ncbi:hypothetical protein V8C86DRAFT_2457006 [Haematococcus lacustris]